MYRKLLKMKVFITLFDSCHLTCGDLWPLECRLFARVIRNRQSIEYRTFRTTCRSLSVISRLVLLTGWGEHVADGAGAEDGSGVDRIVGKPVRLDELLTVIADLTAAPGAAPSRDGRA
jgi:hypothetical protein